MNTLNITQAANALHKTRDTIRAWYRDGKIKGTRDASGYLKIPETEVQRLMSATRKDKPKRLMSVHEAARYLCITTGRMTELIKHRQIPYIPAPTRVDVRDLDAWIERSKISAKVRGTI